MTREEFIKAARIEVSEREWNAIEELYMHVDVTWEGFIRAWRRMVPLRRVKADRAAREKEVEAQRCQIVGEVLKEARAALEECYKMPVSSVLRAAQCDRLLRAGMLITQTAGSLLREADELLSKVNKREDEQ